MVFFNLALTAFFTLLSFDLIQLSYANSAPNISPKITIVNDNAITHKVTGNHGAVAAENSQCSNIGLEILKEGGSAVDSVIASALCVGVINGFATVRTPAGEYDFIDFRETAPAAATEDMYLLNPSLSQIGGLAVSIPGELRGYELAHSKYGRLPWARLFRDAIKIAKEGFLANQFTYQSLKDSEEWLMQLPEFVEIYAADGTIAKPGQLIRRPALSNTLNRVALEGADAFYKGFVAKSLVDTIKAKGGILTVEDFANYHAMIRPVINTTYHGRKVFSASAPTSGPITLNILNLIERFKFSENGPTGLTYHRLIEALKFGYAARSELGDPSFLDNNDRLAEIITKKWADRIRRNITDDTTHPPTYYNSKFENNVPHGTMHLSVLDKDGGAVSFTSTLNLLFGSHVMDPVTGIILNCQQEDFSSPGLDNIFGYAPSPMNFIKPGKRPLSSISPIMIENENGQLEMVMGSSGGSQIVSGVLNVLMYPLGRKDGMHSTVQAIIRHSNGTIDAMSDPRKFGLAAAY
ncbi:gamma-glutamyltransferase [Pilaira anomala]|nr:gamma-glutamyltransferase [Pilaira anomala]